MAEEAIKRKIRYAKKRAMDVLLASNFKVIPSDNSVFCFIALRKKEIRMIRVVVDKITREDEKIVNLYDDYINTGICTKEIWCRKEDITGLEATCGFEIKNIY